MQCTVYVLLLTPIFYVLTYIHTMCIGNLKNVKGGGFLQCMDENRPFINVLQVNDGT